MSESTAPPKWRPPVANCHPAAAIFTALGMPRCAIADALQVNRHTLARWASPRTTPGGTGGAIPHRYHGALLDLAVARGVLPVVDALLSVTPHSPPPKRKPR